MYQPTGERFRRYGVGKTLVYVPNLAQNDPERAEKMAWIRGNCSNRTRGKGSRLCPYAHLDAGPYRFVDNGVLYDEEAMAATFEANPRMSEDSMAYNAAFPHKSWQAIP